MLGLAGISAQEKKEDKATAIKKENLVGVWEAKEGVTIEFTKDGKIKIMAKAGDQTFTSEGTYAWDGDKLQTTMKMGDKQRKQTLTIKTLTDKLLITVDEQNRTDEFKKK
jgi:uncharacterized protein (TIGR03066 family)